jgi:hypothetical protein
MAFGPLLLADSGRHGLPLLNRFDSGLTAPDLMLVYSLIHSLAFFFFSVSKVIKNIPLN